MLRLLASTLVLALGLLPLTAKAGPHPLDLTDFTPRLVNIGIDATDLITPAIPTTLPAGAPGDACYPDPIRISLRPAGSGPGPGTTLAGCRDEHITMNPSAARAGSPMTLGHPATEADAVPEAAAGNGTGTTSLFAASGGAVPGNLDNVLTGFYNQTPGAIVLPDTGPPGVGNDPFNPFDGETAPAHSIFVPEVILRAFIDAGGALVTHDPNGFNIPWSDLVYTFETIAGVPTGHLFMMVTGTVHSVGAPGLGALPFIQTQETKPGIGANVGGAFWDLGIPIGTPGDPNNFIPGASAGVAYFSAFSATPLDGFCSTDAALTVTVLNVTLLDADTTNDYACIPVPGDLYDPATGYALMTGPTVAGALLLLSNGIGDVRFSEIPEPGALILLGASLAGLAALRIRRKA